MTDLIQTATTTELVRVFNNIRPIDVPSVKRFASKDVAVRRVSKMLTQQGMHLVRNDCEGLRAVPNEPVEEPTDDTAEPAPRKERKKRGMRFVFPAANGGVKPHRPGTKRATVVSMLLDGATFEEIQAATGWKEKDAYEGIRLVHYHLGYGMKQDDEGRIFLTWRDAEGNLRQSHA